MELTLEEAPSPQNSNVVQGNRLQGVALATVLIAIMCTLLLAALDQTIVGTALPTIIGELHGANNYSWVLTAYLLTSTTVTPIVGKLSDVFGRKVFILPGIVIFLIGSALSGASQTMTQLILFRGLQGLGAGMILALVFTLVGDIFSPTERARWQGLFTGVFALASVIGPTAGGWITDNINWRWVFYVNIPVGIAALILITVWLPTNISPRNTTMTTGQAIRRIDFAGAFTAAGATVCLLLGLTWGGTTYAWSDLHVIIILAAAVALFISFIVIEIFAKDPVLPLSLFRNQVFAAGAALAFIVGLALFATVTYLPYFVQGVMQQPATNSGIITTPLVLTMAVGAVLIGQLIARVGRYQFVVIIGSFIMAGGVYLLTQMGVGTTTQDVTRNMIVLGLGIGLVQPVMTLAVQNAIPRNRLGVGTSAVTYLRSLGSTIGVALISTIITNTMASDLPNRLPAAAQQLPPALLQGATSQQVLADGAARAQLTQQVVQGAVATVPAGPQHDTIVAGITQQTTALMAQIFDAARHSFALGLQNGFYTMLGISGLLIIIAFFLKDVPLGKRAVSVAVIDAPVSDELGTAGLPALALASANGYSNGATPRVLGIERPDLPSTIGNGTLSKNNGNGNGLQSLSVLAPYLNDEEWHVNQDNWYERYEAAKQNLENVVVAFLLAHPEYLPASQRSVSRYTLQLLEQGQLKALEDAMQEASVRERAQQAPSAS
jgi:EmrB/QacA subfamily drug resistance transporter